MNGTVAVARLHGSDCALRTAAAVERATGLRACVVSIESTRLPHCQAVVLPGGVAAQDPIMRAVRSFAAAGGPVLGFAEGFAALCAAGLLPGSLRPLASGFLCGMIHVRVEGRPTPFSAAIPAGRILSLPVASLNPRYELDESGPPEQGRVVLRVCDAAGGTGTSVDATVSDEGIAAVCNAAGNVLGMTPCLGWDALLAGHSEQFFRSLALHLKAGG